MFDERSSKARDKALVSLETTPNSVEWDDFQMDSAWQMVYLNIVCDSKHVRMPFLSSVPRVTRSVL